MTFTRANGTTGTAGNVSFGFKPGTTPSAPSAAIPSDRVPWAEGLAFDVSHTRAIDPAIASAIETLTARATDRSLAIFDLPSDPAAFDLFALGAEFQATPLPTLVAPAAEAQHTQAMPRACSRSTQQPGLLPRTTCSTWTSTAPGNWRCCARTWPGSARAACSAGLNGGAKADLLRGPDDGRTFALEGSSQAHRLRLPVALRNQSPDLGSLAGSAVFGDQAKTCMPCFATMASSPKTMPPGRLE